MPVQDEAAVRRLLHRAHRRAYMQSYRSSSHTRARLWNRSVQDDVLSLFGPAYCSTLDPRADYRLALHTIAIGWR